MHVAAAAFQLHAEGGYHHHFAGTDDVGEVGIDFHVEIFRLDGHDRVPGLLHVGEGLIEHDADEALFGGCEFTTLDLGMEASFTAEKIVDDGEYQFGIKDDERRSAQGIDLDQVEAGGHEQAVYVFREFEHLHAGNGDLCGTPQHVEETDTQISGKALVDHLQCRQAPADNAILTGEIVGKNSTLFCWLVALCVDVSTRYPVQQGIDLFLGKQVVDSHETLLHHEGGEIEFFHALLANLFLEDALYLG